MISFPIPLAGPLSANQIEYIKIGESQTAHCKGTAEAPTAEKDFLCVYEDEALGESRHLELAGILKPGAPDTGTGAEGASTHGAVVLFGYPASTEAKGASVYGTWAVTGA